MKLNKCLLTKLLIKIQNKTPLHLAVIKQNKKIIDILLSFKDINPNIKDEIFIILFINKINMNKY